jgi:hypothetical protein
MGQSGLWLVRGQVRLVAALLAVEVHVEVAPRGRRIILPVWPSHALQFVSSGGRLMLSGVAVCLTGIAICGRTGMRN